MKLLQFVIVFITAGAIAACDATPVFVDCDERYQIDIEQVKTKISKTKVIMPVHWEVHLLICNNFLK